MKASIFMIAILLLVGCKKTAETEYVEKPISLSKYWMDCEVAADKNILTYYTTIERCENKEVICYLERDSMQCSFKTISK
jgi:hypothetical protein